MEHQDHYSLSVWLKNCIQDKFGYEWDQKNTSVVNLGLDSISSIEFIAKIEKNFGISLPSGVFFRIKETDELLNEISSRIAHNDRSQDEQVNDYEKYINPYLYDKLDKLKIAKKFVKASGVYLYDSEGQCYLDFLSQYGATPFGHHPLEIWKAIQDFNDGGEPIFAQPSLLISASKLGKALLAYAPQNLKYVTFTNSGAETAEAALKVSRNVTGRVGILSTRNSFHGKTFGALSVTNNAEYQQPFGLPLPDFDVVDYNNLEELKLVISSNPQKYACFIVEPIQGEGGVIIPAQNYLRSANEICKKFGVIFIVDEIQTGMGRTGNIFCCNDLGVMPDILLLSKALGGGMIPIGAMLTSEKVYTEKFALKHSSTFAGNALAAHIGLATIKLLTKNNNEMLVNIRERGAFLKRELEKIRRDFPAFIKEVRGQGLMLGLRFTRERNAFPEGFFSLAAEQKELTQLVSSYLLNVENIRVAPTLNKGDTLRIQPPYIVSQQNCEDFIDAFRRMMNVLSQGEMGAFYKAILSRKRPSVVTSPKVREIISTATTISREKNNKFAFILHPLDKDSYLDYDKTLHSLNEDELHEFSESMSGIFDPVIGSEIKIVSNTGAIVHGDFIMVCYTANQLLSMPVNEAITELKKAVTLAIQRGAQIVGLGAYTSIITAGGEQLINEKVAITSGNSFTVYSGIEALKLTMKKKNLEWENTNVCVIGAAGAIGSCMSIMLSFMTSRIILIGNPAHDIETGRARLLSVAREIIRYSAENWINDAQPCSIYQKIRRMLNEGQDQNEILEYLTSNGIIIVSNSINSAGIANLIITTTSSPDSSLDVNFFRPDAVILDISRPRTITKQMAIHRPDIIVLDGGIISLPGDAYVGPYGIAKGTSYACMAETILWALEEKYENKSIGCKLDVNDVIELGEIADKHGLHIAELQSFGKKLYI